MTSVSSPAMRSDIYFVEAPTQVGTVLKPSTTTRISLQRQPQQYVWRRAALSHHLHITSVQSNNRHESQCVLWPLYHYTLITWNLAFRTLKSSEGGCI